MLRLVADDQSSGVLVLPVDLSWAYHPYGGGADVIASTEEQRHHLRSQFMEWTSDRDDGL